MQASGLPTVHFCLLPLHPCTTLRLPQQIVSESTAEKERLRQQGADADALAGGCFGLGRRGDLGRWGHTSALLVVCRRPEQVP